MQLGSCSDEILTHYVESTVDDARYWQPPDEAEGVLEQPEVRAGGGHRSSPRMTWDALPERPKQLAEACGR
ncbi:hypothetical protein [uncultured Corynebacterium sp.]|uniref:hypothetical protein n=1 Tax=uncultured Corynebacterium sp. TaxID=159447 RepID=UPI0025CDA570|nr:hypothetical protein [uncultured Corynebacterium sp.]